MKIARCIASGSLCLTILLALAGCTPPTDPGAKAVPAETPLFDPPPGEYGQPVDVTIASPTDGAAIFYTTDSAEPGAGAGIVYDGPVHLAATTTILAVAVKEGMLPSPIAIATYTISLAGPEARNVPPVIGDGAVTGLLTAGQANAFAISCTAVDGDGAVESVIADLSDLGGPADQPLTRRDGDTWSWSGSITPTAAGTRTITLAATDNDGTTATLDVDVTVQPGPPPAGALKWSFETGDWIWSSPAIDASGTVYVGSLDGHVYAINPDGTRKWAFQTGAYVYSSPAIGADGTIYVGSRDFRLYALNPESGSEAWSLPARVESSPAIGADGTIYIGTVLEEPYAYAPAADPSLAGGQVVEQGYARLYAVNADGLVEWTFKAGGTVWSSPAVAGDGTIYAGSRDHNLYAIDPAGHELWRLPTRGQINSSPAIGADGTIYVGSGDGQLYAVGRDGSAKWSFDAGAAIDSSPAIGADGTIYVGAGNSVYAIDPDGTEWWEFPTGGAVTSSPAIAADGTICVGSRDGKVYALGADGTPAWSYQTGGAITASPAIGPDGTVYVGSYDGRLYALNGAAPLASGPWPAFRRDLSHTARAPAPANVPPEIRNAAATITDNVAGIDDSITVVCTVEDADGTVMSVHVDLSAVGGPAEASLISSGSGQWQYDGILDGYTGQPGPIRITATDDDGATATVSVDPGVVQPDGPPVFIMARVGLDYMGYCWVYAEVVAAAGSYVQRVEADLSSLGGPADASLYGEGDDEWSYYGLAMPAGEPAAIILTAWDDKGRSSTTSVMPYVRNEPPVFRMATASASVGTVTYCALFAEVYDPDGYVASVQADLTPIGGLATAGFIIYGPDQWLYVGPLSGYIGEPATVRITAFDDQGESTTMIVDVTPVPQNEPPVFQSASATVDPDNYCTITAFVSDPDGTVVLVEADLTSVGGGVQVLQPESVGFLWSGPIDPQDVTAIWLTAVDNQGQATIRRVPLTFQPWE